MFLINTFHFSSYFSFSEDIVKSKTDSFAATEQFLFDHHFFVRAYWAILNSAYLLSSFLRIGTQLQHLLSFAQEQILKDIDDS